MATVNKNFRIKNGLIVEGATGTIDGFNILTESQASQDFIVNIIGGTATSDNTPDTVVKRDGNGNFSTGQISLNNLQVQNAGSIYEDSGFIIEANNGYSIAIIGKQDANIQSTTGSVNLTTVTGAYVNEDEIVTRTAEQTLSNKELVNPLISGQIRLEDSAGTFEALISLASDELLIDTDSRNIVLSPEGGDLYLQNSGTPDNIIITRSDLSTHSNISNGVHGVSGDIVGTSDTQILSNKTIQGSLNFSPAGSFINGDSSADGNLEVAANQTLTLTAQNGDILLRPDGNSYLNAIASGNEISTRSYADSSAATAETNANTYTDTSITNLNLSGTYDALGAATQALADANTYTDGEIAALVDSAPALLDTLNELAAAIADNPNYATDAANAVAGRVAKSGDTMTGDLVLPGAPTLDLHAATKKYVDDNTYLADMSARGYADGVASTAQSNAESYADSLSSNYDASGSASTAESNANSYTDTAIANGDGNAEPMYQGVKLGYYTELISSWANVADGSTFSPASWSSMYGTAKLTVHVRDGVHSQASEILIARDSSNNLHVTEYAVVTTNGTLADISASYLNGTVSLTVSPTNGHTNVEAVATGSVIVWAD